MDLHVYENGVKELTVPQFSLVKAFTINHSQVPPNMSNSDGFNSAPHVALLPSAGMGHLTPFLRLAASLVRHQCHVVLITTHPTVSLAESQAISTFLSAFPQVVQKPFNLLPLDSANPADDPFFLQWETIRRSAHLLLPLLSSMSPHLSVLISDVTLFSSTISITSTLGLRNYVLFTSSARMFSLLDSYPNFVASNTGSSSVQFESSLEIPDLGPIPKSSIPPALLNTNSLFAKNFLENAQSIIKSNGVLINTFESLESDTLSNLNRKRVEEGRPPLYALGPFLPWELEKRNHGTPLKWLDDQPEGSVVYVSFGSRTALSREQMKELGNGLEKSGERFLWVVKDKKVDKEDEESLDNLLDDDGFIERIKNQGLLIKGWVDQEAVLSHRAVSGFITHGGWNSLVEAAWYGVPVFVWPQGGDQKVNAEAVERSGLGIWRKSWGWSGEAVVKGEEIAESIKQMVVNNSLRNQAAKIREEARKAVGFNGSSEMTMNGLVEEWKKKEG